MVYLTLLAESHARLLGHLRGLKFFRADLVRQGLHYASGMTKSLIWFMIPGASSAAEALERFGIASTLHLQLRRAVVDHA